jgi:hypothetical protein
MRADGLYKRSMANIDIGELMFYITAIFACLPDLMFDIGD